MKFEFRISQINVPELCVTMAANLDDVIVFEQLARALRRAFYSSDQPIVADDGDDELECGSLRDCLVGDPDINGGGMLVTREPGGMAWEVWFDDDDKVIHRECRVPAVDALSQQLSFVQQHLDIIEAGLNGTAYDAMPRQHQLLQDEQASAMLSYRCILKRRIELHEEQ